MTSTDPTLQPVIKEDERRQFFFWLGVFVLPLFWSWFTLSRKYTRRERVAAFLWLAVFGVWLLHERSALAERFETLAFVYPAVLGWVTVALYVWLFFRSGYFFFSITPIEIIVLVDILGVIQPSIFFVDRVGKPFDWEWLLPAGIAVVAHLVLEPLGLGRTERKEERPSTIASP
jgi:hypothetical protein